MEEQKLPIKNGKIDFAQIEAGVIYVLSRQAVRDFYNNDCDLGALLKAYAISKAFLVEILNNYEVGNITILFKQVEGYVQNNSSNSAF